MSLKNTIEQEIKAAMLSKNKERLQALRSIKSLILLAETEKGSQGDISEDAEIKLLTKAAKQRKDSLDIYKNQGRDDLASVEAAELQVIEGFLPKQLAENEVEQILINIISSVQAKGPQDMGKVMAVASKELSGKADGKLISSKVKELLSK